MIINPVNESTKKTDLDLDTRREIQFKLTKLRTEAQEALYQFEELDDLNKSREILSYLVSDAKSIYDYLKKVTR